MSGCKPFFVSKYQSMKNKTIVALFLLVVFWGQQGLSDRIVDMESEPANFESNQHCFSCHAERFYTYENEFTGSIERKAMNPNFIYNPDDFYQGVHRHFSCTDCHSPDYEIFPHNAELRLDMMFSCMDCHGGDDTYAQYNFDLIQDEFYKSVHADRHFESFDCWSCHDPHSYRLMTRSNFRTAEIVSYHNQTCTECHQNPDKYQLVVDGEMPLLENIHSFLPNYRLHFNAVRCIECHTSPQDTMWVAHNILPKEMAVKNCVECHSTNTRLMSSLYRYQAVENRNERGFFNAIILNDAYVIGANRNQFLNIASLVILGMVLLAMIGHIILRIIK
jgi:hypothetical protein